MLILKLTLLLSLLGLHLDGYLFVGFHGGPRENYPKAAFSYALLQVVVAHFDSLARSVSVVGRSIGTDRLRVLLLISYLLG